MKTRETKKIMKEITLVGSLFALCGFALYQFHNLNEISTPPVATQIKTESPIEIKNRILEPLDKKLAFTEVEFDVAQGLEFHQPTGTHVIIPKNAIVDKNNKAISGKVKFKFREMHDAKAIFLSGIPMQTETDRSLFLESNGMLELRVFQNNEELSLKEGENIQVDLAAKFRPSDEFKLWELENDIKWKKGGSFQTVNNDRRDQQLLQLEDEKKKRKKKKEPEKESNLQFVFNANLENFPHMAAWKDIKWDLTKPDPNFNTSNIERIDWTDINMVKTPGNSNEYNITLTFSKEDYSGNLITQTCSIKAVPTNLSKKELEAKNSEFADLSKEYESFLELARKEEQRLREESALLNKFKTNGFGIYNIDKLSNADQLVKLDVEFDFENELLLTKNPIQLLVISPELNTVLNFMPSSWNSIPYLGPNTELFASLPDGKYAYVDASTFAATVKKDQLSEMFQNKVSFKTRRLSKDEVNNYF